jgi:hypothetical protein
MKIKAQTKRCLEEAKRRYQQFHPDEVMTDAWTGLGFKREYKQAWDDGFMEPATKTIPRCMNWWKLTPKGANVVHSWIMTEINI